MVEITGGPNRPRLGGLNIARYAILFGPHAMDHIPAADMPAVADAAHAVVQEAINAGVYLFAGGLADHRASIVAVDGTISEGPYPEAIGGVTLIDVSTREEALAWAAQIAVACRCAHEVWEFGEVPVLAAMLRHADGGRLRSDNV